MLELTEVDLGEALDLLSLKNFASNWDVETLLRLGGTGCGTTLGFGTEILLDFGFKFSVDVGTECPVATAAFNQRKSIEKTHPSWERPV